MDTDRPQLLLIPAVLRSVGLYLQISEVCSLVISSKSLWTTSSKSSTRLWSAVAIRNWFDDPDSIHSVVHVDDSHADKEDMEFIPCSDDDEESADSASTVSSDSQRNDRQDDEENNEKDNEAAEEEEENEEEQQMDLSMKEYEHRLKTSLLNIDEKEWHAYAISRDHTERHNWSHPAQASRLLDEMIAALQNFRVSMSPDPQNCSPLVKDSLAARYPNSALDTTHGMLTAMADMTERLHTKAENAAFCCGSMLSNVLYEQMIDSLDLNVRNALRRLQRNMYMVDANRLTGETKGFHATVRVYSMKDLSFVDFIGKQEVSSDAYDGETCAFSLEVPSANLVNSSVYLFSFGFVHSRSGVHTFEKRVADITEYTSLLGVPGFVPAFQVMCMICERFEFDDELLSIRFQDRNARFNVGGQDENGAPLAARVWLNRTMS